MSSILWMLSCAAPEGLPSVPAAESPRGWASRVQERLAADRRQFRPRGDTWAASAAGLRGAFDADGARFATQTTAVTVRLGALGRAGGAAPLAGTLPGEGDCETDGVDATGACLRPLEYHHAGVLERWHATPRGFEQTFLVHARPDGSGPVTLELEVEGAAARADADEVVLQAGRAAIEVSGLAAWDDDGRALPARFVTTDDGFAVEVDDRGATYPIFVDPLYDAASWHVSGEGASSSLGSQLTYAGDLDGDGFDDVAVGIPEVDYLGYVYIYYGGAGGLSDTADLVVTGPIDGSEDGSMTQPYFGVVAPAGDVNADGYDDLLVGAYWTGGYEGAAHLYLGGATGLATSPTISWFGTGATDYYGSVVGPAGDVNADGYDDIVVGTTIRSSYRGRVDVYHGGAAGPGSTPARTYDGSASNMNFGAAVAPFDGNGDGYDDLAIGEPGYNGSRGRVLVYNGGPSGLSASADSSVAASAAIGFGFDLVAVGDDTADGYDDLVVGAPNSTSTGGAAFLHRGSASGLSATAAATWTGGGSTVGMGWRSSAGDVNGDGWRDLVLGAYGSSSATGHVLVYLGSATGLSATATTTWAGEAAGDYFGATVQALGDLDADGHDDVLVGAPYHEGYTGRWYVYRGGAAGPSATPDQQYTGSSTFDHLGYGVRRAGDLNGDGYDDLLVPAYYRDGGAGAVFVYHGGPDGPGEDAARVYEGAGSEYRLGWLAAGVGDVNADGYDDALIGYPYGPWYRGTAYIYHGSALGLGATPARTLTGSSNAAFSDGGGPAGDVNGDGYDDLFVSAPTTGTGTGRTSLYLGSASGIGASPTTVLTSSTTGDRFGQDVAAADFDGDGHMDVAVGAVNRNSYQGAVVAWYGDGSGAYPTSTTVSGGTSDDYLGSDLAAGDFDGDGYADLAIAVQVSGSIDYRIHAGSAAGLGATVLLTLEGLSDTPYLTDADARDLDGDGYADLLLGAFADNDEMGRTFVYRGSAGGLEAEPSTILEGQVEEGQFGASVAAVGDVNGDGAEDIVVAAIGENRSGGTAYLYLGTPGDADGDGFPDGADCDDDDASRHPGAPEECNGVDDDCDGTVDESVRSILFQDVDGDGYGQPLSSVSACAGTPGFASLAGDCDDGNATRAPGLADACDGLDNDCDGRVDERDGIATCADAGGTSADRDGDGWGADVDCGDGDASRHPGAAETCNGRDDDCDGEVDEAVRSLLFEDIDGDGAGTRFVRISACPGTAGYADNAQDCDDTDPSRTPGSGETCDGVDNDCDGAADDGGVCE